MTRTTASRAVDKRLEAGGVEGMSQGRIIDDLGLADGQHAPAASI